MPECCRFVREQPQLPPWCIQQEHKRSLCPQQAALQGGAGQAEHGPQVTLQTGNKNMWDMCTSHQSVSVVNVSCAVQWCAI